MIVPRGVEGRPAAPDDVRVVLEPARTLDTGHVREGRAVAAGANLTVNRLGGSMATGRALRLLAVASVALGACGQSQAGVPWRLFGLVSPPAGFVGHCQDSLRHVRAPQLLCRSSAGPAEWSVRLDSTGGALLLARSVRVGPGRAGAIVDSLRAYLEPRLGPGEICPVGLGHTWYRDGWNTFVVVQGSDFTAAGDTLVSVLVAAARGPQDTPC